MVRVKSNIFKGRYKDKLIFENDTIIMNLVIHDVNGNRKQLSYSKVDIISIKEKQDCICDKCYATAFIQY
jgi:hypothetical protein